MTPAEYRRLNELFEQAVALPPDQRAAFVDAHPEHAVKLAELLAADATPAPLLDGHAGDVAAGFLAASPVPVCGPYRLEEKIGEGGTGVVYRGRRADLDSVAAIKVLRDAWISPSRRQRFEREQRTLASLQHPGIAALLDAGLTADGTPWIAMELVEGVPLAQHASDKGLTVEARLRLVQQVCAAVQYAHERAVIHRDLKPSNILVDARGNPRLLDFGIAHHIDDTDQFITRPELRLLTPAYAAPEQHRGEAAGVYSDVYALGVILYELLARRLPAGGQPPSASGDRASGPAAWDELDVICAKAMQPAAEARYRGAGALSRDIERYLAGEPLEARPESTGYRVRKFLARNRARVAAAVAVIAVLGATAGYFTWRLRESRDEAVAAAVRAQRIQGFLMNLFEGGDAAAGPSRGLTVETLIDRGAREAGALDREPAVQGEVYETLGRMYGKLGKFADAEKLLLAAVKRNAGRPEAVSSLTALALTYSEDGRFDDAQSTAGRAIAAASAPGVEPRLATGAREALGRILTERGKYPEAIQILRQVLASREAAGSPAETAAAASALSAAHFYAGELDAAREVTLRGVESRKAAHGDRHPLVADDWISLGAIDFDTGRYREAEQHYRRALDVKRAWHGAEHPDTASAETMLGRALVYQDRHDEARALLEHALAVQEKSLGADHSRVASTLNDLGNIGIAKKDYAAAEQAFRRMEEIYRRTRGDEHYLVATALSNRATVYLRLGEPARAEAMFRDVVARYTRALSAGHANTAIARIRLGRSLVMQKRWADAAVESRAGYDLLAAQAKAPVSWLQGARQDLTASYAALGDEAQAARFRAELAAAR